MKKIWLLAAVIMGCAFAAVAGDSEIIVESVSDGLNPEGFKQVEGKWTESAAKSAAPGLQGTKAVFNDAADTAGPGVARFTPDIPVQGKYEVFATYPKSGNAAGVNYRVVFEGGESKKSLDQNGRDPVSQPSADTWFSLGIHAFKPGGEGYVEISDPLTGKRAFEGEPNARIYADAVKLVPQGFTLPADYVNKGRSGSPAVTLAAVTPGSSPSIPAGSPSPAALSDIPSMASLPPGDLLATPPSAMPALADTSLTGTAISAAISPSTSIVAMPPPPPPIATPMASASLPNLLLGTPSVPAGYGSVEPPAGGISPAAALPPMSSIPPMAPPSAAFPGGLTPPSMTAMQPTPPVPPGDYSVTQDNPANLQWTYDFGAALNSATNAKQPVMVFFTAQGNRTAALYEREYFTDPNVRQALNNYVLVKIDFPKFTRLGYSLGVYGAGIIVVTDASGDVKLKIQQIPDSPAELLRQMAGQKPADSQTTATK